jgi:hypothetical protein
VKRHLASLALAAALLAGCTPGGGNDIGTVDVQRMVANWPKFINYNNQLNADAAAIERSNMPEQQKQSQRAALRRRYADMQNELQTDVQGAASQVAGDKHLKLVVTKEAIGYGGVDITPDVEKVLKIVESSPAPTK